MFIHTNTLPSIAAAVFICTSLCGAEDPIDEPVSPSPLKGNRIAIIGGGISGTFTAKYLAEYDVRGRGSKKCLIDEIDIFDVSPPPFSVRSPRDDATIQSSADPRPPTWQGSRVSTLQLNDGSTIELGASIIYSGNKLVVKLMEGDPDNLVKSPPMSTGKKKIPDNAQSDEEKSKDKKFPSGFGIYHGMKEWLIKPSHYLPSFIPKFLHPIFKKILLPLYFLWRYSTDYFRLRHAVKRAVHAFDLIYELLEDDQHEVTFFESPMDIWDAIGLRSVAGISFHDFLDGLGLKRCEELELEKTAHGSYGGFWWIPGCLRSELVTAMTINTYNQDLNQMNGEYGEKVRLRFDVTDIANNCFNGDSTGLVGLVAYVPAGGELFSVEGGNYKLMKSAIRQATKIYDTSACPKLPVQRIQQHQKRITTVVSGENSMEIFSADESLGNFDIVILAAPLQQSRIQFLMESPMSMDPSVLHPMALNGIHENPDLEDNHERSPSQLLNNEHGQLAFTSPLPPSATTPYTSVVTTVVSNATLNATHFGLSENEQWPRSILVSERGKLTEGITTLTILDFERGLMKTFSSEILTTEKRNILFGSHHALEYVQVWGGGEKEEGGKYGGATPNFDGGRNSESLPFLLYDGAKHWGKGNAGSTGPALYYVNAIESAVAAIEVSAIGAKSTAKLVARRLGLVNPASGAILHEEL